MHQLTLDGFNAIPRVGGLLLSPDGKRLVASVQSLSPDGTRFVTSLWELPSDGTAPARRLTYSERGESQAAFLPDGSLVFASARPDPTLARDEADGHVWLLPAGGGEARPVLAVPGGVGGLVAAADAPAVVVKAPLFHGVAELEPDADKAKRRKDAGVSAVLLDGHPIRFWDHELGPRQARLLRLADVHAAAATPENLTPDAGIAVHEAEFAVSPDGRTLVTTWWRSTGRTFYEIDLVAIDAGGCRRISPDGHDYHHPAVSPDGRHVAAVRVRRGVPGLAPDQTLWLLDLAGGEGRELTPGLDLWPGEPVWARDGSAVYFAADEQGRGPVYRVDIGSGRVSRLTAEGAFGALCPAPDGSVYALRASYTSPAEVVRIDPAGTVTALPTPGLPLELPGEVTELSATADDGTEVRAWLVLPRGASAERPAPLVLWVHGGPLSSWNTWHWRWCPHLMAERGYAVLLPDPALSTGYGHANVQRAWGHGGAERVFADLMAVTDAALARPDLDASRTAAMGGSYGGYMSNWIAGHTDRFRAIVTHASLWALDQFHATTDVNSWWERQYGDPYEAPGPYVDQSPRSGLQGVRTPMLVIHGRHDYRVPLSEALRLWTDLQRHGVTSRFLYFPDENHWVLKPGNARVWYETVLAFLDHHVLGAEWRRPDLV
ncbi:MAG TPA: S9 family peptidase [Terriglobales bacterium]|nr:S9 family peptidase [Terriglobales bacterium]